MGLVPTNTQLAQALVDTLQQLVQAVRVLQQGQTDNWHSLEGFMRRKAATQFRYSSSQAMHYRDPGFKNSLIEVRICHCSMVASAAVDRNAIWNQVDGKLRTGFMRVDWFACAST